MLSGRGCGRGDVVLGGGGDPSVRPSVRRAVVVCFLQRPRACEQVTRVKKLRSATSEFIPFHSSEENKNIASYSSRKRRAFVALFDGGKKLLDFAKGNDRGRKALLFLLPVRRVVKFNPKFYRRHKSY